MKTRIIAFLLTLVLAASFIVSIGAVEKLEPETVVSESEEVAPEVPAEDETPAEKPECKKHAKHAKKLERKGKPVCEACETAGVECEDCAARRAEREAKKAEREAEREAKKAEREAELEKQKAYAEQQAKKNAAQAVPEKVEAKNKQRRYSPDEAKKLLPKVELSIREQEAMMKILEMKMADPANHADPAQSAAMAAEHDEYENKIMELMEKWEQLMEASEG